MGLSIKNEEVERLARKLALEEGISITEAINRALKAYHRRPKTVSAAERKKRRKALEEFAEMCAQTPTSWDLTEDEILGYDEYGVPTQ